VIGECHAVPSTFGVAEQGFPGITLPDRDPSHLFARAAEVG